MKFIISLVLGSWFLFFPTQTFAQTLDKNATEESSPTFAEIWNNVAYYDTNLEKKRFAMLLDRFEGKAGVNLGRVPAQLYGVIYLVTSQDENYWNNSAFYGGGARLFPFKYYQGKTWANQWLKGVRVFIESLTSNYQKDASTAKANNLAINDTRWGIEVWHKWNLDQPDMSYPWGELWANLSHRQSNFDSTDFEGYLLYFQPKFGMHLGQGIEPYLRYDLALSARAKTTYYYYNIADYGFGVRFAPWRGSTEAMEVFKEFKMYAEVLNVNYLKTQPTDLSKKVSSDVKFGVEFSYGR